MAGRDIGFSAVFHPRRRCQRHLPRWECVFLRQPTPPNRSIDSVCCKMVDKGYFHSIPPLWYRWGILQRSFRHPRCIYLQKTFSSRKQLSSEKQLSPASKGLPSNMPARIPAVQGFAHRYLMAGNGWHNESYDQISADRADAQDQSLNATGQHRLRYPDKNR